jgi:putative ABC transport system substrate-binding protein
LNLNRHERANFAVMQNTAFFKRCGRVIILGVRKAHETARVHTLLGGAAAWLSPARAQEPRRVIGVLSGFGLAYISDTRMPAFVQGLKDAGFVEGMNISIEIRQADGHYDRLPSLAAELVGRDVAALFATDVPSAFAAKAATKTIPIVFSTGADPVKVGLVDSLKPNGNLTGVSLFFSVLGPKPRYGQQPTVLSNAWRC